MGGRLQGDPYSTSCDKREAVAAFMFFGLFLALAGAGCVVLNRAVVDRALCAASSVALLIAFAVTASIDRKFDPSFPKVDYGFCFGLTIVAFILMTGVTVRMFQQLSPGI